MFVAVNNSFYNFKNKFQRCFKSLLDIISKVANNLSYSNNKVVFGIYYGLNLNLLII